MNDANADQLDSDGDGAGDVCDACEGDIASGDDDNDGVCNDLDNCPNANADQANSDNDSLGDACDNCPNDDNENQADADEDEVGDVCDKHRPNCRCRN